jgi:hypothetical protein
VEGSRFTLSRTPPAVRHSAPTLGRDNHYVLEKILRYGEDKITEAVARSHDASLSAIGHGR